MAKKVDLGFGSRTTQKKEIKNTTEGNLGLADALIPKDAAKPKKVPQKTKYVAYEEIYLNDLNDGLSMDEIEQLADSIQRVGLQQPLLVVQDEKGKYRLISGHRRFRAITLLKENGKWNEKIECKVAEPEDIDIELSDQTKELYMLLSGNINREKTAQDRLFEMKGWQSVYDELKKNKVKTYKGIDGIERELKKAREYIQNMSGMSSGDLARLKKIEKNAAPEVVEKLNSGEISVNTASEISSLPKEEQLKKINNNVQEDNGINLNRKIFINDTKTIQKKIKNGIILSHEDEVKYKELIKSIEEILEKY